MKLSSRARTALVRAGFNVGDESALAQLVAFAAQNSSIEPRNYYDPYDAKVGRTQQYKDGRRAFQQEQRSISADWARVKNALAEAYADGVTDTDIIDASRRAFSGRLEWVGVDSMRALPAAFPPGHWEYTTGQYWPTEYRKAAASVLEYATLEARRRQPQVERMPQSISELKALNASNGMCWFDKGSMHFFGTRIESGIIRGHYFITSEQPPHGQRQYSIRSFDAKGDVDTVGEFCAYSSKAEALKALGKLPEADKQEVAA